MRNVLASVIFRMGLLTAVLSPTSAFAQTPAAPEALTFDAAIQRAIEKNPTVLGAATAILRAEGLLQQARAATLPTVTASLNNVTLDHARGFSGGTVQPQNQTTIGADVSVPVLATSRWAARTQAADQMEIAKLSLAEVRRQISVATAQAYLAVIAAQRQIDVNQRARETAAAHLDYARKRLEGGAGTRLNELRAAQEVTTDETRLEIAGLALIRARQALGVLTGSDAPVDANGEPSFEVPAAIDVAGGLSTRSDVKLFTAQRQAAERVLNDSIKDILPTVTASFDPQILAPSGLFQPSKTWRLTIAVSQPIFTGGLLHAVKTTRQASVDAASQALAGVQLQARSEIRLAQEALQSFDRALTSARLAAQQAAEIVQITTSAFQQGATTNIEVIDAQRSARDAATAAVIAEDQVRQARLELLVSLGRFPK